MSTATSFIAGLVPIPLSKLAAEDQTCIICQEHYPTDGSGLDKPVTLPCKHIIGHDCMRQWISPNGDEPQNTCPMCRAVLFTKPRSLDAKIDVEEDVYVDNLTILCEELKWKLRREYGTKAPEELRNWDDAAALHRLVGKRPIPSHPYNHQYLWALKGHWRTWNGGPREARKYEEIWKYVAGMRLRQE